MVIIILLPMNIVSMSTVMLIALVVMVGMKVKMRRTIEVVMIEAMMVMAHVVMAMVLTWSW